MLKAGADPTARAPRLPLTTTGFPRPVPPSALDIALENNTEITRLILEYSSLTTSALQNIVQNVRAYEEKSIFYDNITQLLLEHGAKHEFPEKPDLTIKALRSTIEDSVSPAVNAKMQPILEFDPVKFKKTMCRRMLGIANHKVFVPVKKTEKNLLLLQINSNEALMN